MRLSGLLNTVEHGFLRIKKAETPALKQSFRPPKRRVRERIRTLDLLVRSQTLYPAELRAHLCYCITCNKRYCTTDMFPCQEISNHPARFSVFLRPHASEDKH